MTDLHVGILGTKARERVSVPPNPDSDKEFRCSAMNAIHIEAAL